MLNRATAVALLGVLALVAAMQVTSGRNDHPDGEKHVQAAGYYRNHWLPPPIGAPETFRSVYGTSYLEGFEVVYLFYGRLERVLAPLPIEPHVAQRLLNLALLGAMVAATLVLGLPPSALAFFATAQLWYVFAYVNGEAMSLFASFVCIVAFGAIHRGARRGLVGRRETVALGLAAGLLTLSKPSFYVFLPFLAAMGALEWRRAEPGVRARLGRGLLAAGALAGALLGVRYGLDVSANGLDRAAKLRESRERHAHIDFKRSTPLEARHYGLALRERGVPLGALFSEWRWHTLSFQSFTGLYGRMERPSSDAFYAAMTLLLAAVAGFVLAAPIRAGERDAVPLAALCLVGAAATIGLSLARSWHYDFQAQGRYLFAIVPVLAARIAASERLQASRLLRVLLLACIVASLHSFAVTGLRSAP